MVSRRGHSSSGRAPALHAGGGRFESDWLHQDKKERESNGNRAATVRERGKREVESKDEKKVKVDILNN